MSHNASPEVKQIITIKLNIGPKMNENYHNNLEKQDGRPFEKGREEIYREEPQLLIKNRHQQKDRIDGGELAR